MEINETLEKNYIKFRHDFMLIYRRENKSILWHKPTLSVFKLDKEHTIFFKKLLSLDNKKDLSVLISEHKSIIDKAKEEIEYILNSEVRTVPDKGKLRRLNLLISQKCTMDCIYCYANGGTYGNPSMMQSKTAQDAVSLFSKIYPEINEFTIKRYCGYFEKTERKTLKRQ